MCNNKVKKSIVSIILVLSALILVFIKKQVTNSFIRGVELKVDNKNLSYNLKPIKDSNIENVIAYSIPSSKLERFNELFLDTQSSIQLELEINNDNAPSKEFIDFGLIYQTEDIKKNIFEELGFNENAVNIALENAPKVFSIALSYNPIYGKLAGFYICSSIVLKINSVKVIPTIIGYDKTYNHPLYGFSSNGGKLDFSEKNIDFSSSNKDFNDVLKASYTIKLRKNTVSNLSNEVFADIYFNLQKVTVKNVNKVNELVIPVSSLENPYSKVSIIDNNNIVDGLILSSSISKEDENKYYPIRTEPGLILNYNEDNWRNENFEIYQWDRFDNILFIDTKDYYTQNKFFTRLAYYVEKKDFKGKLLTNEQIKGKHGYNAHDYSFNSISSFYNKAYDNNVTLNKEELMLKKILLDNNFLSLSSDKNHVQNINGAIASISRESSPWLRKLFLSHEGMHTLFFSISDFRDFISTEYYSVAPKARMFLIDYFDSQKQLGYDTKDNFLMLNEFMAYLMQQPVNAVSKYFVRLAKSNVVKNYTPQLSSYVIQTNGKDFENAAKNINDFIFYNYGIVGGNLCLIKK